MEKPQSLTTPPLAAVTNPLFSSHFVKMNAGLTQAILEVNQQHGARKKPRKFCSLLTSHSFMPWSRGQTLIFWGFNPLKIIQLKMFMPQEHLAHPTPAPPASAPTQ